MHKTNKKILIVEDDEDFVFILEKKFTSEGFTVITAKNGEDGISVAEKEKPELILSDMLMPKMDGVTMATKIRVFNKEVPIMFLTNIKDADRTDGAKVPDGVDYIIKADTRIDDIVAKAKTKLGIK